LALEPNHNRIEGHFLTNVLLRALPAGLTDFLVVSALVLFCREFGVDADCVSTSCSIIVAIVGFMILYRIAKPMNAWHIALIGCMIVGWLFSLFYLSAFFGITGISKQCAMLMVVFAVNTEPVLRYFSLAVEKIYGWVKERRRYREWRLHQK
jgi:cation-transporting ATPase E